MPSPKIRRRWPRLPVDLPVRVVVMNGIVPTTVPGRGTELSEGGMALFAGVNLKPGDLMLIEFLTACHSRMTGIVRTRNGYYFGLEFLTPLELARRPEVEKMSNAELDQFIAEYKKKMAKSV